MGEAKNRSRSLSHLVSSEERCLYCDNPPDSAEHMPPICMFRERSRPSGLEFASCTACNNGTSSSDLVASFISRLNRDGDTSHWAVQENQKRLGLLRKRAPGVLEEIFDNKSETTQWVRERGVLVQKVVIRANGPILRDHLTVFSAKMGMALYREHVGNALPLTGGIHIRWYLNAGLSQDTANSMLRILPLENTLKQGKFSVPEQFAYRYNTDEKSIVAALASFNTNFHAFIIASSDPHFYKLDRKGEDSYFVRPGELLKLMPKTL